MSRITKWKLEKNKVKVVFRLQFNATHIPQTGWDKLFISFSPADSGKTIAKTTKANVRNGTCKWADPIYETTRLLQDVKNKQFDEKLYKLVVSMGSSRSSILGEATINLADYAEASKPSAVALPLQGCNAGTILHVTVQLLTSKTGFREFEQQREHRERGLQSGENKHDESVTGKVLFSGETDHDQIDKVSSRVRFRPEAKELSSVEEEVELNEEHADLTAAFDSSSNTSESLYAEKHDSSSAHETDSQGLQSEKGNKSDNLAMAQSSSSVHGWASDCSMDKELAIAYEENNRLRASLELAESSIFELKLEVSTLQSQANELGSETEKFSHLLTAEISSSEELAKEVSVLKSECSNFKGCIERLRTLKSSCQNHGGESCGADSGRLVQDLQLRWMKGISVVEDRIKELQNKVCLGFYERDYTFLHSELEALHQIVQEVKLGARDEMSLLNKVTSVDVKETKATDLPNIKQPLPGLGLELDLCTPENLLHHIGIPPLVSQGTDSTVAIDAMKAKIFDLVREVDEAKVERENLLRKMDQMECYYEALVQELEENQKQMLAELQNLRNEHSTCLYTISSSKAEMELMRQDMSQRVLQLADERRDLDTLNKELERRAATSEAALKRARLNYSIAVDKLQKDLELLSSQVVSMFETNENLIKLAIPEPSQSQFFGYADVVQNIEEYDNTEQLRFQDQHVIARKLILSGDVLTDDLKKSLCLQEELYRKVEEELGDMHSINLHLDIFSMVLLETVFEANANAGMMKRDMYELAQQLEASNLNKEHLAIRLQAALEDVHILHEEKASCILRCSDLVLQNQSLEAELVSLSKANCLLTEKVMELEAIMVQHTETQNRYEACVEENIALSTSLKQELLNNSKLQDEISLLKDDLLTVRANSEDLASSNENLHEDITFVQGKLAGMVESYEKDLSLPCNSSCHELELRDIRGLTMQLEEVHYNVCSKILHLMQEKQNLESEKSVAEVYLNASRSEIISVKQKYKNDIQSMAAKINVSTTLVEKLQVELESVTNKLQLNTEVEEKHAQQNRELLDDLAAFEAELQNFASENGHISQEILGLDSIANELEQNDLIISELIQEKEDLMTSLHDKAEEFAKLTSEVSHLRDNLRTLQDELQVERGLKDKLEGSVQNLTLQLNERDDRLLDLEKQIAELVHFRQLASELEIEKSRLSHLLLQHDEHAEKLQEELSCVSGLEGSVRDLAFQLNEKHDRLLDLEKQNAELGHFRQLASDLEVEKSRLDQLLQQRDEHIIKLQEEMYCLSGLEDSVQRLTSQLNEKNDRLLDLEKQNAELSELVHFRELASDLGVEKSRVDQLLQQRDEHVAKLQEELSGVSGLECSVRDLTSQLNEKHDKLLDLEKENAELVNFRQLAADFEVEKCRLDQLVQQRDEHVTKLQEDLSYVSGLESSVQDLTFQLNEKNDRLLDLEKQNADLVHFRQLASELGIEKSRLDHLLQQCSKEMVKLQQEFSYISDLKRHMLEIQEYAIASDVKFTVAMSHCETVDLEFVRQLKYSDGSTAELQKRCHDLQAKLNQCLASEACSIKENKEFLRSLSSVRSDLEASTAQNNVLSDAKYVNTVKLEEYKKEMKILEDSLLETNNYHALEVEKLKNELANAEEELNYLSLSKEELEIMVIVLRGKLDELQPYKILQEKNKDEMVTLQLQCNELTHKCNELTQKLSEQSLKTAEFKNLSIHLKELKDKADAECLRVSEKRESEGRPVAMQESLRIVFIKEQYESKFQELKQQVSISKKHGEDMLLKLQDALDEIESRKRSEALHLKKNEDLALKILSLESELQSLLSDKREIMKDHDRIKAELECAFLSLECCKEEKEKLEITLRERAREYSRIATELTSTREQLMNVTSSIVSKRENGQMGKVELAPNETNVNPSPDATPREDSSDAWNVKETTLFMDDRSEESNSPVKLLLTLDAASVGVHATTGDAPLEVYSPPSNGRHIDFSSEQFGSRNLRSSMEHLHEELERMKRENSLIPEDHYPDPSFEIFQSELMQLHKANEELRSMFPTFKDIASTGNALERVLALEIELAEALKAKNKPSMFQSSFLKQHSDDEAIFKSFRDINELIKEMLEIKEKHVAKENELREMHDRYSQLSLQFAEVEGERQKLKMTLKNVRASRTKLMQLNRSSSSVVDSLS
ncbi:uncharacterized protein LOC129903389 [Solanum dulcamara]|uniref:uncharacterized protein LOC129903389 n=1 Tax=Solanum dulcamara TaxID=45834 RepID=UPI0024863471|nr:uncharacterized protein LOC129903389 [Solanum dulcamara]XP_055834901.1 uncharacterized protein LOC129903389 [Solanum dulcamara]